MKEQFCTYEIALQLKELEFDEPCFGFYVSNVVGHAFTLIQNGIGYKTNSELTGKTHILAPLWQQVIDWLDSEFGLLIVIVHDKKFGYQWKIITNKNKVVYDCAVTYQRLYDAREIAILKCIELINGRNI